MTSTVTGDIAAQSADTAAPQRSEFTKVGAYPTDARANGLDREALHWSYDTGRVARISASIATWSPLEVATVR